MFYCVPAWYSSQRSWGDVTNVFYRRQLRLEFDDTIHQFKTLCYTKEKAQLVILNYVPQLRHFLYQQKLENESYYSVFDDIQNISLAEEKPFNIDMISWPKGADFVFTPFLIVVMLQHEKFAQIEFTVDGNIYYIDFFNNGERTTRYFIDDRGFISSVMLFENNQPQYQEYLNEAGIWQFREYLLSDNSQVIINPKVQNRFKLSTYDTMTDLISEKITDYFKLLPSNDVVIIASCSQHNDMLLKASDHMNSLLSFFDTRYDSHNDQLWNDINRATGILTDSIQHQNLLVSLLPAEQSNKVLHTTAYDARLSLGKSQRIKELNILYYAVNHNETEKMLVIFGSLYSLLPSIRLKIIVKDLNQIDYYQQRAEEFNLRQQDKDKLDVIFDDIEEVSKNNQSSDKLVDVVEFYSELAIIEAVETARLVIDTSISPNTFLQIASISAGVPQVNCVPTAYVSHLENGYIINNIDEMATAIYYYFSGLTNWNKALVHSVRLIQENSGEAIVNKWKGLIHNYGKTN